MEYTAYHFVVEPPLPGSEILIAHLAELGFESFENTEQGFVAYLPETTPPDEEIAALSFEDFQFHFRTEKIRTVNWNEEWEKNFEPVVIEGLLCIRAPFHAKPFGIKHDIVILPKMSFGTGHHQTTRMICRALCKYDLSGKVVLDMGCGTGILAILAHQLGAKEVLGIDIDDWCVQNARENCDNNHCPDIEILKGDASRLTHQRKVDILLANINKNILKKDMAAYVDLLNVGGSIWLSGFFVTDAAELIGLCTGFGLEVEDQFQEDNWAALQFRKT